MVGQVHDDAFGLEWRWSSIGCQTWPCGRPPRRRSSALRWGLSLQLVAILLRCFNRESSRVDQIIDSQSPKLQRFWRMSTPSAAVIGVCRPALRIPRPTLMANLTPART